MGAISHELADGRVMVAESAEQAVKLCPFLAQLALIDAELATRTAAGADQALAAEATAEPEPPVVSVSKPAVPAPVLLTDKILKSEVPRLPVTINELVLEGRPSIPDTLPASVVESVAESTNINTFTIDTTPTSITVIRASADIPSAAITHQLYAVPPAVVDSPTTIRAAAANHRQIPDSRQSTVQVRDKAPYTPHTLDPDTAPAVQTSTHKLQDAAQSLHTSRLETTPPDVDRPAPLPLRRLPLAPPAEQTVDTFTDQAIDPNQVRTPATDIIETILGVPECESLPQLIADAECIGPDLFYTAHIKAVDQPEIVMVYQPENEDELQAPLNEYTTLRIIPSIEANIEQVTERIIDEAIIDDAIEDSGATDINVLADLAPLIEAAPSRLSIMLPSELLNVGVGPKATSTLAIESEVPNNGMPSQAITSETLQLALSSYRVRTDTQLPMSINYSGQYEPRHYASANCDDSQRREINLMALYGRGQSNDDTTGISKLYRIIFRLLSYPTMA